MPKSIYPSVDEMTNLKTRDRKRNVMNGMKKKGRKTDKEYKKEYKEKLEQLKKISRNFDATIYYSGNKMLDDKIDRFRKNIRIILEIDYPDE